MTTQIIFSIVIVFFILYSSCSSSVSKGEENGNYDENARNNINPQTNRTAYFLDNEKTKTASLSANIVRRDDKICGSESEKKNETCTPKCLTACNNGHCTQPDTCKCNAAWGGDFCNEPLVCFIIQPSIAQIPDKGKNLTDDGPQKLIGFAECLPECRAAKFNCTFTTHSKNKTVTYCWISIHSPCNIAKSSYWDILIKHKYYVIGGAAIVIILLAMIICICCILRRKKKLPATKEIAGSYEMFAFSDIPLQSRYPEYMEDNSIYS